MKQCPNPNCILYTRLEELPDAYTKCPGCGGQLVDASLQSGKLKSGYLAAPGSLVQRDIDQEFEQAFPEEPFGFAPAPAAQHAQQFDDEYYPYEDTSQDESVEVPPLGISRGARVAYVLALLLLLFSCTLFLFVMSTKLFSQPAVTAVDATETAIVAARPAVNTPVDVLPTVPLSDLPPSQASATTAPVPEQPTTPPAPTQPPPATTEAQLPPTDVPATQVPPVQVPPTQAPVPPTSIPAQPQTAQPTAPPAQGEPSAGVIAAEMVIGLDTGESAGNVSAYHATDPFVLAVQAQFGPGGVTTMKTRWYGPDGALLYEIPRDSQQGTYYTGFTLKKSTPWLSGDYRVDIHTNNSPTPAFSVSFSVVP